MNYIRATLTEFFELITGIDRAGTPRAWTMLLLLLALVTTIALLTGR